MRRIVLLFLRIFYKVPYYWIHIKQLKNFDKYSVEDRYNFIRKFVHDLIKAAHVDVVSSGIENLPEKSGYLITPNHQGMFDILMLAETHQQPLSVVCKKELETVPLVKDVINAVPAITMDRSNLRESVKVIRKVGKEIGEGKTYIIFPEGTRSKNGNNLLEFKGGTMKAAVDQKAPIVPTAIIDSFIPFDSKSVKRVTCEIHYLKPLYYDDYKDLTSIELAAKVQGMIQDKINEVLEARK